MAEPADHPVPAPAERDPYDERTRRRDSDAVSRTIVAVMIVVGATVTAAIGRIDTAALLACYGVAAGGYGLPIVVRRNGDHH